jgi:hypothetical protein
MHYEITEERFYELNKILSFLESRKNIRIKEWSNMEGMVQGIEVICRKTNNIVCLLYVNNVKKTYFFKEIFEKNRGFKNE